MNQSSGEMPQFDLPPPPSEQAAAGVGRGSETAKKPEQAAAAPERATNPAGMPALGASPLNPMPQPAQSTSQSDDTSTTKSTKKPLVEDTDLIEKEWVNKAKRIVENTRNDPHKQSEELTVVKAEYMKQQYGKTIKLGK
jgi:hypothetical protein